MDRATFIRQSIIAAGTVSVPAVLFSSEKKQEISGKRGGFNLKYAPHHGQFKHHAGPNILDQIRYAHELGFRAFEDNNYGKRPVAEQIAMGELLGALGMEMGVFVLNKGGNAANSLAAGNPAYVDIFLQGCREAIELSKRSGGRYTTVVPGDFHRSLPQGIQTSHVIAALKRGAEILEPEGIIMVLEPLSDTPDLFLRTSSQAYQICRAVQSPSCKILFDVYHLQRNEGNLLTHIDQCWDEIAYFQVGDNPGRKEPTTGEIHYKNLFRHIYQKGYRGIVGMEHGLSLPGEDGEKRLVEAYQEVDDFLEE